MPTYSRRAGLIRPATYLVGASILLSITLLAGESVPATVPDMSQSKPSTVSGSPTGNLGGAISSAGTPHDRMTTHTRSTASCSGGYTPAWLAYDSADRSEWVASPPSCVEVFQASGSFNLTASIRVGLNPFGVAVDNGTNEVFVTDTGSNNVTVISAKTNHPVATIAVGVHPYGVTYDWRTRDVYVANGGSNNVTVISGKTLAVVASVAVGQSPLGIVADPQSRQVFVADHGSHSVSVISDSKQVVVATVAVGKSPYGIALDNASDEVFVTCEGSNNISVIHAATDSVRATIPVVAPFSDLQGLAYDARTGVFWVGAGSFYAVLVNAAKYRVVDFSSFDPSGVSYDPDNGNICVTNTANYTFACRYLSVNPTVRVTFSESGLPARVPWSVKINESHYPETTGSSSSRNITFSVVYWYVVNSNLYLFRVPPTHGYVAIPRQGTVAMNGHPVVVNVSFIPATGNASVSFREMNLTPGSTWYLNLTNATTGTVTHLAGIGGWLNVTLGVGNYSFTVQSPGYSASHIRPSSGAFALTVYGFARTVRFL